MYSQVVEEPLRRGHDRRDRQDRFRPRRFAAAFQFGRQVVGMISMRLTLSLGVPLRSAAASSQPALRAGGGLQAPAGQAPPVAPPLKKGSPLDHLANDPKLDAACRLVTGKAIPAATTYLDRASPDRRTGGQGWGWVKKSGDALGRRQMDRAAGNAGTRRGSAPQTVKSRHGCQLGIRFWGKFASYKAYDPRLDEQLPVFVLQGYEVIGPAAPLTHQGGTARPAAASRQRRLVAREPADPERPGRGLAQAKRESTVPAGRALQPLVHRQAEAEFRQPASRRITRTRASSSSARKARKKFAAASRRSPVGR